MSAFHVGQMVIAVQGTHHTELLGRPGVVLRVGVLCAKPYAPEEDVPGLEVDIANHGPIRGAYAAWIPVDECDPAPSLIEEVREEIFA